MIPQRLRGPAAQRASACLPHVFFKALNLQKTDG